MEVLEDNFSTKEDKESRGKPKIKYDKYYKLNCNGCNSLLQFTADDIYHGEYGLAFLRCPLCGHDNYLWETEVEGMTKGDLEPLDIILTADNVKFPEHFAHTCVEHGAVDVNKKEIEGAIKRGVEEIEATESDGWETELGTMRVRINRLDEDGEYYVVVSKDYYSTYLQMYGEK